MSAREKFAGSFVERCFGVLLFIAALSYVVEQLHRLAVWLGWMAR